MRDDAFAIGEHIVATPKQSTGFRASNIVCHYSDEPVPSFYRPGQKGLSSQVWVWLVLEMALASGTWDLMLTHHTELTGAQ